MSSFGDEFTASALPDHFAYLGESATVTPSGGEAADVTLVAGGLGEEERERGAGTKRLRDPVFTLKTSEVTVATLSDAVIAYRGANYSVAEITRLDEDAGYVTVRCTRATESERARPGFRDGPRW